MHNSALSSLKVKWNNIQFLTKIKRDSMDHLILVKNTEYDFFQKSNSFNKH